MKNISKESLKELLVPVPDLLLQQKLAAAWERGRASAAAKRKQAAVLRAGALNDFIAAVSA